MSNIFFKRWHLWKLQILRTSIKVRALRGNTKLQNTEFINTRSNHTPWTPSNPDPISPLISPELARETSHRHKNFPPISLPNQLEKRLFLRACAAAIIWSEIVFRKMKRANMIINFLSKVNRFTYWTLHQITKLEAKLNKRPESNQCGIFEALTLTYTERALAELKPESLTEKAASFYLLSWKSCYSNA